MLTKDTITDDQIRKLRDEVAWRPRQNAYTRAIRKDCDGALHGSRACRESAAHAWNEWKKCATCKGSGVGTITRNPIGFKDDGTPLERTSVQFDCKDCGGTGEKP